MSDFKVFNKYNEKEYNDLWEDEKKAIAEDKLCASCFRYGIRTAYTNIFSIVKKELEGTIKEKLKDNWEKKRND